MASNLFKVTELSSNEKEVWNPQEGTEGRAAAAKSLQSCPTLCNPIDGGPPGSSVPGILQARTLEWVAFPSLGGWAGRRNRWALPITLQWTIWKRIVKDSQSPMRQAASEHLSKIRPPGADHDVVSEEGGNCCSSSSMPPSLPPALWEVGANEAGGGQGRR